MGKPRTIRKTRFLSMAGMFAVLLLLALLLAGFTPVAATAEDAALYQRRTPTPIPTPGLTAQDHLDRGLAAAAAGDFFTAIEEYTMAIELDPEFADAYNNRGVAYQALGDYEAAIEDYTRAIEANPEYAIAYRNRGLAYLDLGDDDAAIEDFSAAIEIDPNYADAYYSRAYVYLQTDQYELAIEDYTRVIELIPGVATYFLSRGFTYELNGDAEESAADYYEYAMLHELESIQGARIEFGETQIVEMSEGRNIFFPFEAEEGQLLTFVAFSTDGFVDPVVIILDEDGEVLASRDDIERNNYNSILPAWEVPADGDYTLLLTHAGGGSYGTVKVLVEVVG